MSCNVISQKPINHWPLNTLLFTYYLLTYLLKSIPGNPRSSNRVPGSETGSYVKSLPVSRHRQAALYPVPGLGSPRRLTGSESTVSYVAASAVVTTARLHFPNNVPLWMNNYLTTFVNQNPVASIPISQWRNWAMVNFWGKRKKH